MTHKYIRKVNYYETDKMQVTHHSNYIRFMEEARTDFLETIGYGYKRMEAENIISPVVSVNLRFVKPTTFADEIEIEIIPKSFSGVKIEFDYKMTCLGEVVCLANSCHCFLNEKSRPISLKRVNPDLYNLFASLISDN